MIKLKKAFEMIYNIREIIKYAYKFTILEPSEHRAEKTV